MAVTKKNSKFTVCDVGIKVEKVKHPILLDVLSLHQLQLLRKLNPSRLLCPYFGGQYVAICDNVYNEGPHSLHAASDGG